MQDTDYPASLTQRNGHRPPAELAPAHLPHMRRGLIRWGLLLAGATLFWLGVWKLVEIIDWLLRNT